MTEKKKGRPGPAPATRIENLEREVKRFEGLCDTATAQRDQLREVIRSGLRFVDAVIEARRLL